MCVNVVILTTFLLTTLVNLYKRILTYTAPKCNSKHGVSCVIYPTFFRPLVDNYVDNLCGVRHMCSTSQCLECPFYALLNVRPLC
jgi:hypothetical protein